MDGQRGPQNPVAGQEFAATPDVSILTGDALKLIDSLHDESLDLTVTSPPYCMGKDYEATSDVQDFVESHQTLLPKVIAKTKRGGSVCWQVGYHVSKGVVTPLDFLVHEVMSMYPEMKLRNRIMWHFGHGTHSQHRFSGRHEVILWYTKGDEYYFDLDSVRVPQKYPGKKHYKGEKRGQYSGNPNGKNPSDVWEIPNVNAMHVEKTIHPCQFPVGLVMRLVNSLSPLGGLVCDPFAGSGSSAVASALLGRRFVGFEKVGKYSVIARRRIKLALEGALPYRPADLPVLNPMQAGSVAIAPDHFRVHKR
jgi:adenine-specific DNA-methyltransferase